MSCRTDHAPLHSHSGGHMNALLLYMSPHRPFPHSSLTHCQGCLWHVEKELFHKPEWLLCRWSFLVSVISVLWLLFAAVIFTLPTRYPVTEESFNYAPAVVGGVCLVVTLAWVLSTRFWFIGPRSDVGCQNSDMEGSVLLERDLHMHTMEGRIPTVDGLRTVCNTLHDEFLSEDCEHYVSDERVRQEQQHFLKQVNGS